MNMIHRKPASAVTLQLLACLALVVLPHVTHLQPWVWLGFGGMTIWRAAAAIKYWAMPPRWLRLLLGLFAMIAVYIGYGSISGQQAGVALLILLLGMKLTELNSFRDHVVVALLAYFVLISQFLFSQELVMVLWLITGVWLVTATLLSISHPQSALPYKTSIRRSAILLLQAAPLMLIFFILFPRIPGPLWGLPSDAGAARSGLSNSMTPGDISHLASTDDVAMRVKFLGDVPRPEARYWRGPVFEYFDGRTWTPSSPRGDDLSSAPIRLLTQDEVIEYEVTLEPHRERWLFTLDMPVSVPSDAQIQHNALVLAKDKVIERRLYRASSSLDYQLAPVLHPVDRKRNLRLPGTSNPRTRELAKAWRAEGLDDASIVQEILTRFLEDEFVYTLEPPLLGNHPIDEFLFDTRRGFCEHYASSFTFLMRAAGIPARIVTGYQGGELNALGDYYILYQSDAHAWSEVWLEGRGWVRIDPTGAVSPLRIEQGLQSALPVGEAMALALARRHGEGLLRNLRLRWDWVNNSWYRWVLAYGPELQTDLMEKFGIKGWGQMILVLTLLGSGFLGALGLILIWQIGRRPVTDPVLGIWQRFSRKLARLGLQRLPHEGPLDYRDRLLLSLPHQEAEIRQIAQRYLRLRYGQAANPSDKPSGLLQDFRESEGAFPLSHRQRPSLPLSIAERVAWWAASSSALAASTRGR